MPLNAVLSGSRGHSVSTDDEVVRAWNRLQRNWWAYDEISEAVRERPVRAWRLLGKMAEAARDEGLADDLGCGPLQDFIRKYGPAFIDRIERRAREQKRFAKALKSAWLPKASDPVSTRLFAMGVIAIGARREKWQTG